MKWYGILLVLAGALNGFSSVAQISISGVVKDEKTGAPLSFVTVSFPGTIIGGLTDDDGKFVLETNTQPDSLRIFMVGYKESVLPLTKAARQVLNITLLEQGTTLEEVSVQGGRREKYRNKDNPAVDLMRKVIEHKAENYAKGKANVTYKQYEKLQVSLIRSREENNKKKSGAGTSFLFKNADTTKLEGKALFPVFVHETASDYHYNGNTKQEGHTLLGEKKTTLEGIVDDNGLEAYFDKIYTSTDIYDNNIKLGDQQMLSPLAGMAPTFYKYFIIDTLKETMPWQVKMAFFPRNQADLLFKGELLITLDSTFAVTRAKMSVNKNINLNWVDDLNISLTYSRNAAGTYYLQQSTLGMAMSIIGKKNGLYGERTLSVTDYRQPVTLPDPAVTTLPPGEKVAFLPEEDWEKRRPQALNFAEQNVYANLDTLKRTASFKRAVNILTLVLSGYEVLGPVELGPVNSFYSFNPVEGFRLKFGGRTTDMFSKRFVLDGHAAYGFKDKRWKYNAGITISLTDRSIFQFPVRALSLHHSFETQIPGQELMFLEEDNFLLSFKRGHNDKWLYCKKWNIDYLHETEAHLSFRVGFNHSIQNPTGGLVYHEGRPNAGRDRPSLTLSEFTGEIRWAPNEQFYQGKKFRRPVFNNYPIFTLRGTVGIKGLMDGAYNYQSITLNIFKRFYLSQLGFSDVILEGGKIFGKVPFPLLYIHKANQTYAYQLQAYNLMNFMEFVSDRYISLNIDHSFNGFFLNKVPLVKKLQLREAATFKAVYGDVGTDNQPAEERKNTFCFPTDRKGRTSTHSLQRGPYIEASLGIGNIFKVLRVDVVKRFTYLDHPGITGWGVRARMVLAL